MNAGLAIILAGILLFACAEDVYAFVTEKLTWSVGEYTFIKKKYNWKGEDGAFIEVWRKGRRILRRQSHDVWVWTKNDNGAFVEAEDRNPLNLSDLNGDGVLDFVIRQWTGAVYCCYTYEVFSLTPDCRRLWHNDAKCGHLKVLKAKNGTAVLAIEDSSFLFWRTHTVGGPRPIVYFTWRGGKFVVDRSRMLRRLNKTGIDRLKKQPWSEQIESAFIELVYSGKTLDAVALLSILDAKDRQGFASDFLDAFRKSPFYYQVVALSPKTDVARLKSIAAGGR